MLEINVIILQFLLALQGVESNNGKDLNHKVITNPLSMHFGQTAIGPWALMPKTIKMLKRDPERAKTDTIYQKKVAKEYALKILQASRGCPLTASILWLKGPQGRLNALDYTTARYKRFIAEWEAFTDVSIQEDPIILRYCQ